MYAAEKLATFWVGDPEADWNGSTPFDLTGLREAGYTTNDQVEVMVFRGLPLLLLPAVMLLWRRRREFAALYALMVAAMLLAAATHAVVRLSVPLQPLLFVILASATVELWRKLASQERASEGANLEAA